MSCPDRTDGGRTIKEEKQMAKTKRALLTSALAIVACVAMLVGSTFAWFTDTASTGVNKIQAGNLKLEVLYRTSFEGEWQTLKDATDLFGGETTLFEPGHTRVVELKIKNAGSLSLKYKIGMNVAAETAGVNMAGNPYKLSDYLKVATTGIQQYDPADQISSLMERLIFQKGDFGMWTARNFANFELEYASNGRVHVLQPGAAQILGIKVYMPGSVGNEANAISSEKAASISFGLNVVATQYTTERDSYGTQYDKDAVYAWDGLSADTDWYNDTDKAFEIKTASDLAGVAKLAGEGNSFAGKTLTLAGDIDLAGKTWTPIKSFAGEFDGNKKTITGLQLEATEGEKPRAGLFNGIEAGSKIHDLTIDGVDATVGASGRVGVLGNYISGEVEDITIKNVKATSTDPSAWVGGLCAFLSWPAVKDCTIENMEVDAPNGAAFIAGLSPIMQKNANFTFENCNVNGLKVNVTDNSADGCGVGGLVGQTQRGWEQPKLANCHVTGLDVTAAGHVQIGGFMAWPGGHTIADDCSVSGKIDASAVTDGYAGGFFGNLGWNCDLGHMGHEITNCTADVDILTKDVPAGGFIGTATNQNGSSMYATFNGCKALGDVTCVSGGTASVGGFAGVADRGCYEGCSAAGKVSGGAVNGGFIGTVKHIDAKYDGRFPVGTRSYEVEQITVKSCTGAAGMDLIGLDDQSGKDSLKRYHDIVIE